MSARWKLSQKHYLMVPGGSWEYKETTNTGRSVKKTLPCPTYLDPDDPADQNYPRDGLLIVANAEDDTHPRDIIFVGNPTPDMVPLNAEAEEISAKFRDRWGQPALDIGEEGYTGALLSSLTETLQAFNASQKPSGYAPVEDGKFDQIMAMNAQLMEMNKALIAKLEPAGRRI